MTPGTKKTVRVGRCGKMAHLRPAPPRRHVVQRRHRFDRKTPRWWERKGVKRLRPKMLPVSGGRHVCAGRVNSGTDRNTDGAGFQHTDRMVRQQLARHPTPRLGARVVSAGHRVAHDGVRRHAKLSKAAEGCAGTSGSVLHQEQPTGLTLVWRQRCRGHSHVAYSEQLQ